MEQCEAKSFPDTEARMQLSTKGCEGKGTPGRRSALQWKPRRRGLSMVGARPMMGGKLTEPISARWPKWGYQKQTVG